jgi:hypothetical protein
VYINNILIYSKYKEDYKKHVLAIVDKLIANSLYIDITKCKFNTKKVKYLGLIITIDSIKIDLSKV